MPASVELKDVRKSFDEVEIIKGVSFQIEPSEFIVLVGPSGCGKSTLLRTIAGLETITSGELLFDGTAVNDWSPAKRRVGMVFQSYALYPHMTVEENVSFGLKLAKKEKAERESRVNDALEILQLDKLRDHKPSQLSGGQRQRVAIGRAIVRKPNVFLFDEPLSNLDTALRVQMRMEIGRLHRRLQNTVVYVTHDQVEAMTLADRIVVMEAGVVRQIGAPLELYERPANKFVAGFMGSPKMGFLSVTVKQCHDQRTNLKLAAGEVHDKFFDIPYQLDKPDSEMCTIGIRPEHCSLTDPDKGGLTGEVLELERLGSDTFAYLEVPGGQEPFAVRLAPDKMVKPGERVGLQFDRAQCHVFDEHGEAVPLPNREEQSLQSSKSAQEHSRQMASGDPS